MPLPGQNQPISFKDLNQYRGQVSPYQQQVDMATAATAYNVSFNTNGSNPASMDEFWGKSALGGGGATTQAPTTQAPTTAAPTTATPTTAAPVYYRIQFCDNFASGNSIAYAVGTFSSNDRVSADGRTAIVTSSSTSNPGGTLLPLTSLGATGCVSATTTFPPVSFNLSQLGCDGVYPTLRANNFSGGNNSWSYVKIGTSQVNAANSSPISIAFNESNYDFTGVYQLSNDQTYYVILADDGGRTAMRSVTPTGCIAPTTTPPTTQAPQFTTIYLGYNSVSSATACGETMSPYYILSGDSFSTATYLYSDTNGSYALTGYYSNGGVWRYWDGSSTNFSPPVNCDGGGFEEIV